MSQSNTRAVAQPKGVAFTRHATLILARLAEQQETIRLCDERIKALTSENVVLKDQAARNAAQAEIATQGWESVCVENAKLRAKFRSGELALTAEETKLIADLGKSGHELLAKCEELYGAQGAERWLHAPLVILNHQTPLQFLQSGNECQVLTEYLIQNQEGFFA